MFALLEVETVHARLKLRDINHGAPVERIRDNHLGSVRDTLAVP